jgi:general stress protein 26
MHHAPPTHDSLWALIKGIRFGMLTHRDSAGLLHSHPLITQNQGLDANHELFFFTPKSGELYMHLLTDGNVNVSYSNPVKDIYISLSCQVRFIEDVAPKEALWTPLASIWFPQGASDPDLALLAVRIRHAEYWDAQEAKMVPIFKLSRPGLVGDPMHDGQDAEGHDALTVH